MRAAFPVIFILGCFSVLLTEAQVCLPSFAGKDTIIPCNVTCFDLKTKIPDLRSTADYQVVSIPYTPFPYVSNAPALTLPCATNDDKFSEVFNFPFWFCF